MLWVITTAQLRNCATTQLRNCATAAIAAGGVLFQLGAMSVWVAIMSLALKTLAFAGVVLMLPLCGWYVWRRWNS